MAPADGLQDAWSDDTRKGVHAGRGLGSGMARAHVCECLHGSGLAACGRWLEVFGEPGAAGVGEFPFRAGLRLHTGHEVLGIGGADLHIELGGGGRRHELARGIAPQERIGQHPGATGFQGGEQGAADIGLAGGTHRGKAKSEG